MAHLLLLERHAKVRGCLLGLDSLGAAGLLVQVLELDLVGPEVVLGAVALHQPSHRRAGLHLEAGVGAVAVALELAVNDDEGQV